MVDVVGVLNQEADYTKAGNYRRWLKRKLLKENVQFVSGTHRLKLTVADGKKYQTDQNYSREMFMKGIDYSYYYEEND